MRHPSQRCISFLVGAAMLGSTALAEQDAQAIRPHEAPITDATPRDEKLTRCADLFTTLIAAPLGFGDRELPDNLQSALKIAQAYDPAEIYASFAIALAFPEGVGLDTILRDLGAATPAFGTAIDRVANPTESYFFNLRAEIDAYDDRQTVTSIVSQDFAACHPLVKKVAAEAPDLDILFDLHASKMARWAGSLRIPISEDLPLRVRLQRCGAMIYAFSTDVEQVDGEWIGVPSGARGLVYFAMKAAQKPVDKASFVQAVEQIVGPVRNALVEMAEMTHRYVATLEFEKTGPNKADFYEVMQNDRGYCGSQLGEEIRTLGPSDNDWPVLHDLPLAHEQ